MFSIILSSRGSINYIPGICIGKGGIIGAVYFHGGVGKGQTVRSPYGPTGPGQEHLWICFYTAQAAVLLFLSTCHVGRAVKIIRQRLFFWYCWM